MTISQWAEEALLADGDVEGCFILITDGDEGYDIEVETANGEIGGIYYGAPSWENACLLRSELTHFLESQDVKVYGTQEEWEDSWDDDE